MNDISGMSDAHARARQRDKEYEDARNNALAHVESILEGMTAAKTLEEETAESVEYDGETYTCEYELQDRMQERALSVEIRTEWHVPGSKADGIDPGEYRIVLTFGGPSLEVRGNLNGYNEPDTATVYYRDAWLPERALPLDAERAGAILDFAQIFYYGE